MDVFSTSERRGDGTNIGVDLKSHRGDGIVGGDTVNRVDCLMG